MTLVSLRNFNAKQVFDIISARSCAKLWCWKEYCEAQDLMQMVGSEDMLVSLAVDILRLSHKSKSCERRRSSSAVRNVFPAP